MVAKPRPLRTIPIIIIVVMISALLFAAFHVIRRQTGHEDESWTGSALLEEDFLVNSVGPESAPAEVERAFGAPLEIRSESEPSFHNPDYVVYYQTWIYRDAEITFFSSGEKGRPAPREPGRVISVLVKGGSWETGRGVKVGDPQKKVFARYGRSELTDGACWYEDGMDYISFRFDDRGRVAAFEIGFIFD